MTADRALAAPPPPTAVVSVRVSLSALALIDALAAAESRKRSTVIQQLLEEALAARAQEVEPSDASHG